MPSLQFLVLGNIRMYPRSGFCIRQNHTFCKPPFCEPPNCDWLYVCTPCSHGFSCSFGCRRRGPGDGSEYGFGEYRRFQTLSSVSFLVLTELQREDSVSSSQPSICVPNRTHRFFFAELTEFATDQPAPKYHTKGCSRSSVDSPGARTLGFAALVPFSRCKFRASIARTPFCAILWRSPNRTQRVPLCQNSALETVFLKVARLQSELCTKDFLSYKILLRKVRPRQGTEICNLGAPSPLEALHWIFLLFPSVYVQFRKTSPLISGESSEKSSGGNRVKSCHVCGCHGFCGPEQILLRKRLRNLPRSF